MPNQPKNRQNDKGTVIYREYSTDEGDPYYPVPNERNRALYRKYQDLALKEPNVIFVGRLASYKYFNMDEVCTFYNGVKSFLNYYYYSKTFAFYLYYTANIYSEITVRTQVKTVKLNYSFFNVTWTSILPYIVQCRSVDSSLQLLHCTWSSNQM